MDEAALPETRRWLPIALSSGVALFADPPRRLAAAGFPGLSGHSRMAMALPPMAGGRGTSLDA